MLSCMSGSPTNSTDRQTASLSKRAMLKRLGGAAVAGMTTVTTTSGSASASPSERSYRIGDRDRGSWNSIHVKVIALGGVSQGAKEASYESVRDGLRKVYNRSGEWCSGFVVHQHQFDETINNWENILDQIEDILDDNAFDDPNWHYHVVHNRQGSVRNNRIPWGDNSNRPISTVSTNNNALSAGVEIRSCHHLLHMYISGSVAKNMTGADDGYDAIHRLGGLDPITGERTVMADIRPGAATSGGQCAADGNAYIGAEPSEIHLSDCTLTALESTANNYK